MNRCRKIRRLLSLFLTDDLDETTARQVRLHLTGCAGCRGRSAELVRSQAALESLRLAEREDRQSSLWPELSVRIARLRLGDGAVKGWIRVGALAAACLAVYVWGSAPWPSRPSSPESPTAITPVPEVAEEVRPKAEPDAAVTDDLRWVESYRARPVLPEAHPVILRSSRQF